MSRLSQLPATSHLPYTPTFTFALGLGLSSGEDTGRGLTQQVILVTALVHLVNDFRTNWGARMHDVLVAYACMLATL